MKDIIPMVFKRIFAQRRSSTDLRLERYGYFSDHNDSSLVDVENHQLRDRVNE